MKPAARRARVAESEAAGPVAAIKAVSHDPSCKQSFTLFDGRSITAVDLQWEYLEGVANRASDLCQALDQWKDGADGRKVSPAALVEIACTLEDHYELPGTAQLGDSITRLAEAQGVGLQTPKPSLPSIELGLDR